MAIRFDSGDSSAPILPCVLALSHAELLACSSTRGDSRMELWQGAMLQLLVASSAPSDVDDGILGMGGLCNVPRVALDALASWGRGSSRDSGVFTSQLFRNVLRWRDFEEVVTSSQCRPFNDPDLHNLVRAAARSACHAVGRCTALLNAATLLRFFTDSVALDPNLCFAPTEMTFSASGSKEENVAAGTFPSIEEFIHFTLERTVKLSEEQFHRVLQERLFNATIAHTAACKEDVRHLLNVPTELKDALPRAAGIVAAGVHNEATRTVLGVVVNDARLLASLELASVASCAQAAPDVQPLHPKSEDFAMNSLVLVRYLESFPLAAIASTPAIEIMLAAQAVKTESVEPTLLDKVASAFCAAAKVIAPIVKEASERAPYSSFSSLHNVSSTHTQFRRDEMKDSAREMGEVATEAQAPPASLPSQPSVFVSPLRQPAVPAEASISGPSRTEVSTQLFVERPCRHDPPVVHRSPTVESYYNTAEMDLALAPRVGQQRKAVSPRHSGGTACDVFYAEIRSPGLNQDRAPKRSPSPYLLYEDGVRQAELDLHEEIAARLDRTY